MFTRIDIHACTPEDLYLAVAYIEHKLTCTTYYGTETAHALTIDTASDTEISSSVDEKRARRAK